MKKADLDMNTWALHLEEVKCRGGAYGKPRNVPVLDVLQPVITRYMAIRRDWLLLHHVDDRDLPLFFTLTGDYVFLSANTVRKLKSRVEAAVDPSSACRTAGVPSVSITRITTSTWSRYPN